MNGEGVCVMVICQYYFQSTVKSAVCRGSARK
jgi:hypothetical protein